ncbi:MAG: hypothetical protein V4772_08560 [Pseudomonadota bacterium]
MKFFMAFLFSIIPAAIVAIPLAYFIGPFALMIGWAIWGLGMEVCLDGK